MDILVYNGNGDYSFSRKADFAEFGVLDATTVQKTFDFAYDMTFGAIGQHREHRSGGTAGRKNGEIFADTFQGKLAEFAIYFSLKNQFEVSAPNLDKWALGKWDAFDLSVNGANVAIKSTKWFGQLLLLETEDWDEEGNYKPNGENGRYDLLFLVRMKPCCSEILQQQRLFYSNRAHRETLQTALSTQTWAYDTPRFITRAELVALIEKGFSIPRGSTLNGKTRMDANNYYCQLADMHPVTELAQRFYGNK